MEKSTYLPTKKSKGIYVTLISILILIYAFENMSIAAYIDYSIFNYIVKPIIWIGATLLVGLSPHVKSKAKLKHRGLLKFWAFTFAIIYIVFTFIAGLIDGLGKSPYSHTVKGILMNLIIVGSLLMGREFIRHYLVNTNRRKKEDYLLLILVATLMTVISFPISRYLRLNSLQGLVQFIAEFLAPKFAHNIFASYLVFLGGPLLSLIYLGTIEGFHWFSPILPDLKWLTSALLGILCPIFFFIVLQNIYQSIDKQIKQRDQSDGQLVGWILTSIFSIAIIWFAVGVFPIYPSVIATGSMEPMIKPGDMILVKKVYSMDDIEGLKKDDVIQFKRDTILITHRIIDIKEDEDQGLYFRTKGDNNSAADSEPVRAEDVKGKIVHVIPKIGWPTLLLRSNKRIDMDKIEF